MSPLTLLVLRRLAWLALAVAALLLLVPRLLLELGLAGPSLREQLGTAERAQAVARSYGATDSEPDLASSLARLAEARRLGAAGQARAARAAAREATLRALAAQRSALAEADETRRRAQQVVDDVDARLSELEDLYAAGVRGRPRGASATQLTLLKAARQRGAGLFVAFERGQHRRVVDEAPAVLAALDDARRQLGAGQRQ